jgi:hypothetical protein
MGEKKKKKGSKLLGVLLVLVLLVGGAGVAGYMMPDLPVLGPAVKQVVTKAAEQVDRSGVYRVTVERVILSEEEFRDGETLDIQVIVRHVAADGSVKDTWESRQYGTRRARAGEDSLTATWSDRPFEVHWEVGDHFVVTVQDRSPLLSNTDLCVWETDPEANAFPLSGTHTFERVKGKRARVTGANQIVFESTKLD